MPKNKKPQTPNELIIENLREKGQVIKQVATVTHEVFHEFKNQLRKTQSDLAYTLVKNNIKADLQYSDKGQFEAEMKLNDEIVIYAQHSNVFTFDAEHFIWRSPYIQEDPMRAHCGMIQVYNFLSDSFKYNRNHDVGYMIARLFVNKDRHFFIEGKRQLGFLYNDIENLVLDNSHIQEVIESSILYTLNFDLLVPPYEMVKELTLNQKIELEGVQSQQTGKRLGFRFGADDDEIR
ncbi:hypothetical protein LBMAG27_19310 [Bacteroidota bacterium]|nr:hypothetical protein LBMAG27_19310 [Bacteroidota bacterium]